MHAFGPKGGCHDRWRGGPRGATVCPCPLFHPQCGGRGAGVMRPTPPTTWAGAKGLGLVPYPWLAWQWVPRGTPPGAPRGMPRGGEGATWRNLIGGGIFPLLPRGDETHALEIRAASEFDQGRVKFRANSEWTAGILPRGRPGSCHACGALACATWTAWMVPLGLVWEWTVTIAPFRRPR